MKSTGIVRKIDDLGRIVIPKEIRNVLNIGIRDPLEIFTEEDRIILKKYEPTCAFCGSSECVTVFKGKLICGECIDALKNSK